MLGGGLGGAVAPPGINRSSRRELSIHGAIIPEMPLGWESLQSANAVTEKTVRPSVRPSIRPSVRLCPSVVEKMFTEMLRKFYGKFTDIV